MKNILSLIFLLCLSWNVNAQEQTSKDTLDYDITLKLGGARSSGVFNRSAFSIAANKNINVGNWAFHNNISYRNTSFNGIQIEDNWYDLFSAFYYPNGQKRWYPLGFYHFDNNLLFRVDRRHRMGIGIGSDIFENEKVFFQVYAGYGYEDTRYNGSDFANSELDFAHRNNGLFLLYLNNNYTFLNKKFNLKLNLFYMQSIKEAMDYDLWFRPGLQYLLTKNIALSINYDYRLENVYLESLTPANDLLIFGLNLTFDN